MFNKIIKRGNRKGKSDSNENAVTVNHASRTATNPATANPPQQPPADAAAPPAVPTKMEVLPLLKEVSAAERPGLFVRKTQICCILLDFTNTMRYAREKEIKRQTLSELVDYLQTGASKMNETMQEHLIQMVSSNILRCLPPATHENTGSEDTDPDEDDMYLEPAWAHMQIVYEILLRYIVSSETDTKVAKRFIDHSFVRKLIDLFDSEDPREREYLKTILHRIYGKFMVHRPFIKKAINDIFYRFLFETERHSGIAELLEIVGSIINGFAVPMREEHRLFLVHALIPLHKAKSIAMYHQPLSYCITQFVEKDYKLADTVIRGLLKYWPLINCTKEVLFLQELEEVLEGTHEKEFRRCMVPLFIQLSRCLSNSNFQVAERALFLWNNEHFLSLVTDNRNVIFPIVFEALEKNVAGHWNQAISGMSGNVRKMFAEMDEELFEECERQYLEKERTAGELEEQRQLTWKRLEAVAAGDG